MMKDIDKLDEIYTVLRLKKKERSAVCEHINALEVKKNNLDKEIKTIEEETIPKLGFFDTCKIKDFVTGKDFRVVSKDSVVPVFSSSSISRCDELYFCNDNEVCLTAVFKYPFECGLSHIFDIYTNVYKDRFPNLLQIWL